MTGMLTLYELLELLPNNYEPTFSPQLNALYRLLKARKLSEKEAAAAFLQPHQSEKYFNKLKHKLRGQLINYLMIHPVAWADTKWKARCDRCYKEFAAYKILLASSRRNAAIELAKSVLSIAKKLDLFELIFQVSRDLEYHYSAMLPSVSHAKRYAKLADHQLELITAEHFIRRFYNQTTALYNTKNSFTKLDIAHLNEAVTQTLPYLRLNSAKLNRLIYNIAVIRHYCEYNYTEIIRYCDDALVTFTIDYPHYQTFRFAFLQKKVPALIALGRLGEAKDIAKTATQFVVKGQFNWHVILLQRIEVCLHEGHFQEAYDIYQAHHQQGCKYYILSEYWRIIRAYLYFFIQAGHITSYKIERFNLGKFLNEMPIYAQDKAGININILLVQILIEMQREQFGRIIDRIEALQAYATKHLRRPETMRAYLFIKMIIAMEKASFHRVATERKAKRYVDQLAHTPLKVGQSMAVELVPYDRLWAEMLDMLANKFRARKLNKSNSKRTN